MFILFKKNIQGGLISDKEIGETVAVLEKKNSVISNIASFVFEHPDFLEYKKRRGSKKLSHEKNMYINSTFKNDGIKINHQITFKGQFHATDFFFSNNDQYLVAINAIEIHTIDVRTGIKVFSRRFNDKDVLEQTYEDTSEGTPVNFGTHEDATSSSSEDSNDTPSKEKKGKPGYYWNMVTGLIEGSRVDQRKVMQEKAE